MTYHAYAGIGSRETPAHILDIMKETAGYLFSEGWTLRSGHADGADKAFENGVLEQYHNQHPSTTDSERMEIYLPWKGFNGSSSSLHPERIPFTTAETDLASRYHPAWHRCPPSAKRLHTRNVRQILGCEYLHGEFVQPVKFVVCWTKDGKWVGGTAQAIRLAVSCDIRVFNLGLPKNDAELSSMLKEIDELQKEWKEHEL